MLCFLNKQAILGAMYVISPVDIIPEGVILLFYSTSFCIIRYYVDFSLNYIGISFRSSTRYHWFAG